MMPSERVLICGAGISGSILAFWLAKHDFQVVVVERAKANQKLGQGLEIEEPALTVVTLMGVLDKLKDKRTGEKGFELMDQHSQSHATFKAGGFSPTGALELMRGDMIEVLYKAADEFANVTFKFETTIQSLRQTENKVIVDLENRQDKSTMVEEFDLVVGADGAKSRTRQLVMGSPEDLHCFKPVGAFNAYFSIPREDQDWPYSRLCHFPDRRVLWLRPTRDEYDITSVYLIHVNDDVPVLRQANATGDRQKQKEAWAEVYSGLGWETARVIEQMMKAENFYSEELVQVKLQKWSQNRVVLLGDAAWAPTPFTGEGSQLAMIGAWVLAQELSRDRSPAAFEAYEKRLRSYVENAQGIPIRGYAPYIFCPQTNWGIWLLRKIFGLASWLFSWMSQEPSSSPKPSHDVFDLEVEAEEMKEMR